MPRVAYIDERIDGTLTRFEAWFNSKDGFYIKDLPPHIENARVHHEPSENGKYQLTKGTWQRCDTLKELEEQLGDAVRAHHENTKVTTKVILFQLSLSTQVAQTEHPEENRHWNRFKLKPWAKAKGITYGNGNRDGYGFTLRWKVRYKVAKNGVEFFDVYKPEDGGPERPGMHKGSASSNDNWQEMSWTEEREAFFRGADQQIEKLAKALTGFVSSDTDVIAVAIQNGTKLIGQ